MNKKDIDYDKLVKQDIDLIVNIIGHDKDVQIFNKLKTYILNDEYLQGLILKINDYKLKARNSSNKEKIEYLKKANSIFEEYNKNPIVVNYNYYLSLMREKKEIICNIFPENI